MNELVARGALSEGETLRACVSWASQTRSPVFEDEFEVAFDPDCLHIGLKQGVNGAYWLFLISMTSTPKPEGLLAFLDLTSRESILEAHPLER